MSQRREVYRDMSPYLIVDDIAARMVCMAVACNAEPVCVMPPLDLSASCAASPAAGVTVIQVPWVKDRATCTPQCNTHKVPFGGLEYR